MRVLLIRILDDDCRSFMSQDHPNNNNENKWRKGYRKNNGVDKF